MMGEAAPTILMEPNQIFSCCLICNITVSPSSRGTRNIFCADLIMPASRQQIHLKLSVVLGLPLNMGQVRSELICRKCFKLLNDVDTVEVSLEAMKDDLRCKYEDTSKVTGAGCRKTVVPVPVPVAVPSPPADVSSIVSTKVEVTAEPLSPPKKKGRGTRKVRYADDDEDYQVKSEARKGGKRMVTKVEPEPEKDMESERGELDLEVAELQRDKESVGILEEVIEEEEEEEEEVEVEEEEEEIEEDEEEVLVAAEKIVRGVADDDDLDEFCAIPELSILDPEGYENLFTSNKGRFKCHACNKCFLFAKILSDHMLRLHSLKVFTCDVCLQEFDKKPDIVSHMDMHVTTDTQGPQFVCDACPKAFITQKKFRDHVKFHMMKIHSCEQCGKTFTSRKLLEEHLNAHAGIRPHKCTTCEKSFAYENSLKNHMKLHSFRPRPFTCKDCHKEFLSAYHLQAHRRVHTGQKDHVCETCGKNFSTSYNLESHKVVHTGERPYGCKYCGKSFGRRELLRDHIRIHTGERPFQCEICGSTFSKRANFVFHKEASHFNIRRYKCEECNKAFTRRRLLDYHNRSVHTGEKPFKCHLCSAAFVYPHHYKKHLKIHTGEKPFKCEICGKAFNSKENRNAHRFIHSEKKPYECKVCGQGFMRKPALYSHMQTQGHMEDIIIVNQLQLPANLQEESEIHIEVHDDNEQDVAESGVEGQTPGVDDMIIVNQFDFAEGEGGEDPEAIQYILSEDGTARDIASFVEEGKVEVVLVQTEVG